MKTILSLLLIAILELFYGYFKAVFGNKKYGKNSLP